MLFTMESEPGDTPTRSSNGLRVSTDKPSVTFNPPSLHVGGIRLGS